MIRASVRVLALLRLALQHVLHPRMRPHLCAILAVSFVQVWGLTFWGTLNVVGGLASVEAGHSWEATAVNLTLGTFLGAWSFWGLIEPFDTWVMRRAGRVLGSLLDETLAHAEDEHAG